MARPTRLQALDNQLGGLQTEKLLAIIVSGEDFNGNPWTMPQSEGNLEPKGYQKITSLSTAQALTVPTDAKTALIQPEVANVRWRDDGINPTATVGMPHAVGNAIFYTGSLSALRFIQESAGAVLNVSYYA